MQAQRALLPNARWHFQHGPIDIVIGANGDARVVAMAHEAAWHRFESVLQELVAELSALRQSVRDACPLQGEIARTMWRACHPYRTQFITPMAAVAGSIAQALIECYRRSGVDRAWINNGGDIALHLADGASVKVGLFADIARFLPSDESRIDVEANFQIDARMPVRGVATSGWRGRSFSLGIADSVTVLARTASMADAAATVIANAVNVEDTRIKRRPASQLKDDSDLGDMLVTVDVPPLPEALVHRALRSGLQRARAMQRDGLIHSAILVCQHRHASAQPDPAPSASTDRATDALSMPAVGSVFA